MLQTLLVFPLLLLSISSATAQCQDPCGSVRFPADANCGVDPNDGSLLGLLAQVCPCNVGDPLILRATYTDVRGAVATEVASTSFGFASSQSLVTFSYAETNAAIQSGSPITVQFDSPSIQFHPQSFVYSPVSSIFFTQATQTVTTTTSAVTKTISTATVTSTTAIPQASNTVPCTTGTSTITANTHTVATTSTITPTPKTRKVLKVNFTTTRASCVPAPGRPLMEHRAPRPRDLVPLEPRAVNEGIVEAPYCPYYFGPPAATTYTTGTDVVTATTTTTDTSTDLQTQTDTTTVTPTPLTTTVCSNVAATTTTTPQATSTAVTTAKQVTVTSTQTLTFTATIYPFHPKPCRPPARSPNKPPVSNCPLVPKHGKKGN